MTEVIHELHSKASEQYEDLLMSTSTISSTTSNPDSTRPSSPHKPEESSAEAGEKRIEKRESDGCDGGAQKVTRSRIPKLKFSPNPPTSSSLHSPFPVTPADVFDELDEDLLLNHGGNVADFGVEKGSRGFEGVPLLQGPVFDRFFGAEFLNNLVKTNSGKGKQRTGATWGRNQLRRSKSVSAWGPPEKRKDAEEPVVIPSAHARRCEACSKKYAIQDAGAHEAARRSSLQSSCRRATSSHALDVERKITHPVAGRTPGGRGSSQQLQPIAGAPAANQEEDTPSEVGSEAASIGVASNMSLPVGSSAFHGVRHRLPLNGTTFGHKRYLVHKCEHAGLGTTCADPENYLTPTQRAVQQVKSLKVQLSKVNHELDQRRKEIADLSSELVKRQLETKESPTEAVVSGPGVKGGAEEPGGGRSRKTSRNLTLPDLTCFNCGFVLTLTSPMAGSCSCSEADDAKSTRAAENGQDLERTASTCTEQPTRGSPKSAEHSPQSPADQSSTVQMTPSLPPPSLTDSGLGKEVEHFLSHRQAEDGLLLASPSSVATDKTHEELEFSKATNLDSSGSPSGDLFVSFEAVEAKLKDCEAEWSRNLEAALKEKNAEMEQLRAKHNDRVEELLRRLDASHSDYTKVWQKYQECEAQVEELQAQVESLTQALTLASKRREPSPAPPCVEKEVQTTLVFTLTQDGELLAREREKTDAELQKQIAKAKEELEQLRALKEARVDVETSCTEGDFPSTEKRLGEAKERQPAAGPSHETKDESISAAIFDSDVTLQFLKSAVFYFLTDRENCANHLHAIQSILNFSEKEKKKIEQNFHGLY